MSAAIACNGTSETGKPGVPNTKLPKNVRYTPLDICRSGLKSWIGARPPSHPARHARPPRRSMLSESRIVLGASVRGVAAVDRPPQAAHPGRPPGPDGELPAGARLDHADALDPADVGDFSPLPLA